MAGKVPLKKGQMQRGLRPKLDSVNEEQKVVFAGDSLLERVENELKHEGIVPFDNSDIMNEYLRLPADLTEVESKELGKYFNTFTKQKMYCRTLLGRTSALLRELTEELDEIKDKVYSELPTKMSVTEKKLKLRSHKRYGEKASRLLEKVALLEEKRNMLEDYLENLIDGIFNISREISRRESDWNDDIRENSINNKRRNR
jgi:vacuolar-type H+-ATPase subunit I/STV1